MPRRYYACAALLDVIVFNGNVIEKRRHCNVRLTAHYREGRSISNSYGMFPARARKNTLNKSIRFHTQETYHLILKLSFDISDEMIIIIRKQLDIIILCLETGFFSLFIHNSIYIIVHIEIV